MRIIFLSILCCIMSSHLPAQPVHYTTANAHSHNDYEQAAAFLAAYNQQYGSIEADVFLLGDSADLWVAHSMKSWN